MIVVDSVFINKFGEGKYISKHIFNNIKNREIIPTSFDLDKYNDEVLNRELVIYKEYFDHMYDGIDDNIHLDDEQRKAILSDEDFSLIIAGAGTGKTTTMASKVKFLVDKRGILPEKIVVMSFTKKSTLELEKRICYDFNIPAKVTTFHSLGYMHIKKIFSNRKCYVIDKNIRNEIFLSYFKEKIFPFKDKVREINNIYFDVVRDNWIFTKYFRQNYEYYDDFDDYFEAYKNHKISEIPTYEKLNEVIRTKIDNSLNQEDVYTLKRELVKSRGEAVIANYLFCNSIDYKYEKVYEKLMDDNSIYRPDFTLELNGQYVYLEYFGFSSDDDIEDRKYRRIREMKEDYHRVHHNKFISITYDDDKSIVEQLKRSLIEFGFILKPLSSIKIYDAILSSNPLAELYKLGDFFYDNVDCIKSSSKRVDYGLVIKEFLSNFLGEEKEKLERQAFYIMDFYQYYQKCLYDNDEYGFDFSDLIYYANKYIHTIGNNSGLDFSYMIIDEYQDISQERYEFTKKIADKNHAKVVAVGDDWQSIYGFSGSKIDYIYNFSKYFKDSKLLKISSTYRNSQDLINYSGEFIMKNDTQIKKNLISNKSINNPIKFIMFDDYCDDMDGFVYGLDIEEDLAPARQ